MRDTIITRLRPIQRRHRLACALRGAVWGAAGGAIIVLLLRAVGAMPSAAVLIVMPLIGAWAGAARPLPWRDVAKLVDARKRLKDRIATALAFSQQAERTPLHELAMADAMDYLSRVDARQVVPLPWSRRWLVAAALFACAWPVALWPGAQASASAPPIEAIVIEAERLEDDFDQLKQLARDAGDMQTLELAEQLAAAAEQMQQPGVDVKDALATLSQMQAMLQQQQAAFDLDATAAELAALGDALMLDGITAEAGRALKRGDYDAAAEALDHIDALPMTDAALDALAQCEAAQAMRMAEAIKRGDKDAFCKAAGELAGRARQQSQRARLAAWMRQQVSKLSECKGACAGNGSNAAANQNWGRGSSGNPNGDPTQVDATRVPEQITGARGEGPMQTETFRSPEAQQSAGRDYREAYSDYRKQSEAALQSEAIPLGHRQTIRRYFESIRPQEAE